jgi:hypothetical protein
MLRSRGAQVGNRAFRSTTGPKRGMDSAASTAFHPNRTAECPTALKNAGTASPLCGGGFRGGMHAKLISEIEVKKIPIPVRITEGITGDGQKIKDAYFKLVKGARKSPPEKAHLGRLVVKVDTGERRNRRLFPARVMRIYFERPNQLRFESSPLMPMGKATPKREPHLVATNPIKMQVLARLNAEFGMIRRYAVDMAHNLGNIFGLVLSGDPGLGKSWEIESALRECGLERGKDYVLCKGGDMSEAALFLLLSDYSAPGKLIIVDDADAYWTVAKIVSLLKAALDNRPDRLITRRKIGQDGEIDYRGRIIFITNIDWEAVSHKSPLYIHRQAVLSRAKYVRVRFSAEELKVRTEQVAFDFRMLEDQCGLTRDQAEEVWAFYNDNILLWREVSPRSLKHVGEERAADMRQPPKGGESDWQARAIRTEAKGTAEPKMSLPEAPIAEQKAPEPPQIAKEPEPVKPAPEAESAPPPAPEPASSDAPEDGFVVYNAEPSRDRGYYARSERRRDREVLVFRPLKEAHVFATLKAARQFIATHRLGKTASARSKAHPRTSLE